MSQDVFVIILQDTEKTQYDAVITDVCLNHMYIDKQLKSSTDGMQE